MQPSVYRIPLDIPGSLWVMPKPSAEWLREDLAAYRLMGMDKIVSLLTRDEAEELGLAPEAEYCQSLGMDFLQHPIADRGLAEKEAFGALAREIMSELVAGTRIGIHCRAGIGRSGMLACCVLAVHGFAAEQSIDLVSRSRGVAVPDTEEQAAFIRDFCRQPVRALGSLL